jgi:hypothetical protein
MVTSHQVMEDGSRCGPIYVTKSDTPREWSDATLRAVPKSREHVLPQRRHHLAVRGGAVHVDSP